MDPSVPSCALVHRRGGCQRLNRVDARSGDYRAERESHSRLLPEIRRHELAVPQVFLDLLEALPDIETNAATLTRWARLRWQLASPPIARPAVDPGEADNAHVGVGDHRFADVRATGSI